MLKKALQIIFLLMAFLNIVEGTDVEKNSDPLNLVILKRSSVDKITNIHHLSQYIKHMAKPPEKPMSKMCMNLKVVWWKHLIHDFSHEVGSFYDSEKKEYKLYSMNDVFKSESNIAYIAFICEYVDIKYNNNTAPNYSFISIEEQSDPKKNSQYEHTILEKIYGLTQQQKRPRGDTLPHAIRSPNLKDENNILHIDKKQKSTQEDDTNNVLYSGVDFTSLVSLQIPGEKNTDLDTHVNDTEDVLSRGGDLNLLLNLEKNPLPTLNFSATN